MLLKNAVSQVGAEENIEAAFIRLYGNQTQPESFRTLFNAVRKTPVEMLQKIQEHADKTPDAAFRAIHPDYVNVGEFSDAVLQSRKPSPVEELVEEPSPVPEPVNEIETEG